MSRSSRVAPERYTIGEVLGSGAMGRVYAARDSVLGRDVAIKVPRGSLPPRASANMIEEARTAASLNTEHVAKVRDAGTQGDVPYIVMERLSGTDLDTILQQEGRIPYGRAVDYVRQACDALGEAHAAGIAHRDVKPGNLFVTTRRDGSQIVKVLDFGVASAVDTNNFAGSPCYVAPEVINGMRGDACSDVWAIGVVLYELIAGRVPFDGNSLAELWIQITQTRPIRLDAIDASVPTAVADVVARCLSRNRVDRFPNAREVGAALRLACTARVGSLPTIELTPRATRRMPSIVAGAACGLALVAAIAFSMTRMHGGASAAAAAKHGEAKTLVASSPDAVRVTGRQISTIVVVAQNARRRRG